METKRDLVKCGKWVETHRKNIWGMIAPRYLSVLLAASIP